MLLELQTKDLVQLSKQQEFDEQDQIAFWSICFNLIGEKHKLVLIPTNGRRRLAPSMSRF